MAKSRTSRQRERNRKRKGLRVLKTAGEKRSKTVQLEGVGHVSLQAPRIRNEEVAPASSGRSAGETTALLTVVPSAKREEAR